MDTWWNNAIFYSIYPLGFCGAPETNDHSSEPVCRLDEVTRHVDYISDLGCNALYLGPILESSVHGYDTADYFQVDRRLGTEQTVATLVEKYHESGVKVILDGVFNHVGREFWAFRDLRENGRESRYVEWFEGISFDGDTPNRDGFSYEAWEGHYDLVTLNHRNPEVRQHLLDAVGWMMDTFAIDGLRLDVAYLLDRDFIRELVAFCKSKREDFFLLGEMIHGDYREITQPGLLDSATNYEAYKGLYSSHNDRNYFEIAWSLKRQFGQDGIYRELPLFNFVDNHDVDRAASILSDNNHLSLLYVLLFTMPGIPSVYYGSELGWTGRSSHGDHALRPAWGPAAADGEGGDNLRELIRQLAKLRALSVPLREGAYRELSVSNEQLCFERTVGSERVVVALNASAQPAEISPGVAVDLQEVLSSETLVPVESGPQAGDRLAAGSGLRLPGYGFRLLADSTQA